MFGKIMKKEMYRMMRNLFIQDAVPILESHGFVKAPFCNSDFGCTNDTRIFVYQMGRLRNDIVSH